MKNSGRLFSFEKPTKNQLVRFFEVLAKKEKIIFFSLFAIFVFSAIFLQLNFYFSHTKVIPQWGGEFKEGIVGQPRFINPLFLSDNDPDRDIVNLVFSGLLKYDEKGKIVFDAAKDYEIDKEGKEYTFEIKDEVFWHDGKDFTAEDVAFTINLLQSPEYKSGLRSEWLGVDIQQITNKKITFSLHKHYSAFPETVARLKIIPKHIFQDISPQNFPWILTNKDYLVGAGPFFVKKIKKDNSGFIEKVELEKNEDYYGEEPYLDKVSFCFYKNEKELIAAGRTGEINGFILSNPKYITSLQKEGLTLQKIELPRYFALLFNLREEYEISKEIRKALNYAINREEIIKEVFREQADVVVSPILADYYNLKPPEKIYTHNKKIAEQILSENGFEKTNEEGVREREKPKEIPKMFSKDLVQGDKGEEVRKLQECLAKDKEVYVEGKVTGYFGPKTKKAVIKFQEKYASEILEPIGLTSGTGKAGEMTREKLNFVCQEIPTETEILKISITTSNKFPLSEMADIIKKQLENTGFKVEINKVSISEIQTKILREYSFETLLFGEALGQILDPFSFWHSSQSNHPGLNISGYKNEKADKLLEDARKSGGEEKEESLGEFQSVLMEEFPAVFIAKPSFLYMLSPKIKGFETEKITDASKRFAGIENWFIKTKRIWR